MIFRRQFLLVAFLLFLCWGQAPGRTIPEETNDDEDLSEQSGDAPIPKSSSASPPPPHRHNVTHPRVTEERRPEPTPEPAQPSEPLRTDPPEDRPSVRPASLPPASKEDDDDYEEATEPPAAPPRTVPASHPPKDHHRTPVPPGIQSGEKDHSPRPATGKARDGELVDVDVGTSKGPPGGKVGIEEPPGGNGAENTVMSRGLFAGLISVGAVVVIAAAVIVTVCCVRKRRRKNRSARRQ